MIKQTTAPLIAAGLLLAGWSASIPAQCADASAQLAELVPPEKTIDGRLDLLLRTYVEDLQIIGGSRIHAAIQSARLVYQSAYYGSGLAVGFDAGLYGAVRLDGGGGSRNMAHFRPDGSGSDDLAWGYPGEYALKLKYGATVVKYGLQPGLDNPYLPPYDIRSMPPTFRGVSVISNDIEGVALSAGSFNGAIPRGDDRVRGLSTAYGGIPFDRISYAGVDTKLAGVGMSVYGSQARDMWNQYYLSLSKAFPLNTDWTLSGRFDGYITRDTGRRLEGQIDNKALAMSITAQKGPNAVLFGYQTIIGDQFFDYTQETAGIYLANAMGVDYNSPHERSYQLRYTFDGNRAGVPGFKLMAWTVRGHGADGRHGAAIHNTPSDPLYWLYNKNGEYIRGKRFEWGIKPSYLVQSGPLKDMRIAFYVYRTRISPLYPSKPFNDAQLMINYPVRVF